MSVILGPPLTASPSRTGLNHVLLDVFVLVPDASEPATLPSSSPSASPGYPPWKGPSTCLLRPLLPHLAGPGGPEHRWAAPRTAIPRDLFHLSGSGVYPVQWR